MTILYTTTPRTLNLADVPQNTSIDLTCFTISMTSPMGKGWEEGDTYDARGWTATFFHNQIFCTSKTGGQVMFSNALKIVADLFRTAYCGPRVKAYNLMAQDLEVGDELQRIYVLGARPATLPVNGPGWTATAYTNTGILVVFDDVWTYTEEALDKVVAYIEDENAQA